MSEQSTGLKATLKSDLTDAIRAKDKVRSSTLRMALSAVSNAEVAGSAARELSEDEVLAVLTKEGKKRREAAEAYDGAGRAELAAQERAELEVIETYLPTQLGDDELDTLAAEAVADVGATEVKQLGQVMKVLQPKVAGRAEGGRVAAAARRALS